MTGGSKSFSNAVSSLSVTRCTAYHGGSSVGRFCRFTTEQRSGYTYVDFTFPTALSNPGETIKIKLGYSLTKAVCTGADGDVHLKEFTSNDWTTSSAFGSRAEYYLCSPWLNPSATPPVVTSFGATQITQAEGKSNQPSNLSQHTQRPDTTDVLLLLQLTYLTVSRA